MGGQIKKLKAKGNPCSIFVLGLNFFFLGGGGGVGGGGVEVRDFENMSDLPSAFLLLLTYYSLTGNMY